MNRLIHATEKPELGYTLPAGALKAVGVPAKCGVRKRPELLHLGPSQNGAPGSGERRSLGYPVTKMANFGLNITF